LLTIVLEEQYDLILNGGFKSHTTNLMEECIFRRTKIWMLASKAV